jgi:hypothetical protein
MHLVTLVFSTSIAFELSAVYQKWNASADHVVVAASSVYLGT